MPRILDVEVWEAIELLAEMSTSSETPGVARDHLMDRLIVTAREIEREHEHAIKAFQPQL
jgi:hypothetical protein